ncbi:hypothetical protein IXB28_15055 [Leptothoe kymatousa TAU-MAC 1615]|uniref:Uncharacterized protein n=1 Tax=Leptothoe kymatousa TAU-MAC 1615 TaxID=2364775 RepID=A0ABS5Y7E7_9CYAN|nr:hypothetical protein [Leptothoe kymatousa TAU-MAC 1615]
MPFIPLFIVISIFLATSKILQPNQQQFQPASKDYDDDRMLNQALIDYIARESRSQSRSDYGDKNRSKGSRQGSSHRKHSQLKR